MYTVEWKKQTIDHDHSDSLARSMVVALRRYVLSNACSEMAVIDLFTTIFDILPS